MADCIEDDSGPVAFIVAAITVVVIYLRPKTNWGGSSKTK